MTQETEGTLNTSPYLLPARKPSTKVKRFHGDPLIIRHAFSQFPSGVAVLAGISEGIKQAIVASSFMVGVSLDPPLVAVAIQKNSVTWPILKETEKIGISIVAEDQGALTRQLAGKDRLNRFKHVTVDIDDSGAVYIESAVMWLEATIHNEYPAGDHWMILLETSRLGVNSKTDPLLWHDSCFRQFS